MTVEYRISSFCSFGDCVEVGADAAGHVHVRDSKQPKHELVFTVEEWAAFLDGAKAGEFDWAGEGP